MNFQPIKFTLRKAITSDFDFIWQLRVTTMQDAIAKSYGWDERTQHAVSVGKSLRRAAKIRQA